MLVLLPEHKGISFSLWVALSSARLAHNMHRTDRSVTDMEGGQHLVLKSISLLSFKAQFLDYLASIKLNIQFYLFTM